MRHQLRTDSSHRVPDCERSVLSSWDHAPCVLCPFHESSGPSHCLQEMARSALRQRPKAFPRQLPSYRAAGHAHFLSTRNESSALELASPLGNSVVEEFSRMRADSNAEAQRNKMRPRNSRASRVCPSITRTPAAFRVLESKMTLCTTLCGRIVTFPVACAAGRVEFKLLK